LLVKRPRVSLAADMAPWLAVTGLAAGPDWVVCRGTIKRALKSCNL